MQGRCQWSSRRSFRGYWPFFWPPLWRQRGRWHKAASTRWTLVVPIRRAMRSITANRSRWHRRPRLARTSWLWGRRTLSWAAAEAPQQELYTCTCASRLQRLSPRMLPRSMQRRKTTLVIPWEWCKVRITERTTSCSLVHPTWRLRMRYMGTCIRTRARILLHHRFLRRCRVMKLCHSIALIAVC